MIFDLTIGGILLVAAIFGFYSGTGRQLFKIAILIGGYFLSIPGGKAIFPLLKERLQVPGMLLELIAQLTALFLITFTLTLIAIFFSKISRRRGRKLHRINRLIGGVLSTARVGGITYLLLGVVLIHRTTVVANGWVKADLFKKSRVTEWVEQNNIAKSVFKRRLHYGA